MKRIFEKLEQKIKIWRNDVNSLVKDNGEKILSEVTIAQAYGGMRGVRSLICDTSRVPAEEGLIIRGYKLNELVDKTPEEIFYLLLTDELPSNDELEEFSKTIRERKKVPDYVWDVLRSMPEDSHPMTMFSTAILVLQKESVFAKKYSEGLKKDEYWKPTLEDALNIIAKVPALAAGVYRLRFKKGEIISPDFKMDLSNDYAYMLGIDKSNKEFYDLMRLYLVAHCDHEGGNVSAFATATVNSALSDLYLSSSAGLNGLAGPLHGLANQECLDWVLDMINKFGGKPTKEQIKKYSEDTLASGKVIPGYGHAVLRVTDPRFTAFYEFGKKNNIDSPVFTAVADIFEVVPEILKGIPKIKNPYPNVDAISGSLLYHYGLKEFSYYTVMFGASRILGLAAQAVVNRALGMPITRPKSVSYDWIKDFLNK